MADFTEKQWAAMQKNRGVAGDAVKVRGTRTKHVSGQMNKLEQRYAEHLQLRKTVGEIVDWKFEPLKLKLAPATFYNPDFMVKMPDGTIEIHETKGWWEDDARVKIKMAGVLFGGFFRIFGVQWDKEAQDWDFEEFKQ